MAINKIYFSSWRIIEVETHNEFINNIEFYIDDNIFTINQISFAKGKYQFYVNYENELLGHKLTLKINNKDYYVDVSKFIDFDKFDEYYIYKNDDLGVTYYLDHCEFRLWAPLAYDVFLLIDNKKHKMDRQNGGIYYLSLKGNYDGFLYKYEFKINDKTLTSIDPYGKSSNSNGQYSAVINFEKTKIDMCDEHLPSFNSYLEAIVYEINVRDMTIDENTNIINKGKYLGLCEHNKLTKGKNKAGIDYIANLGISHVQLMPVLDFVTVDENNASKTYNWGYDPMQYFTLEGSYSTSPNDPYSRIKEFKMMVSEFHKCGIRVNLDVVFNHIYEVKKCSFEKITPGYYFRKDEKGNFSNASFCGNDFASEKPMVKKLFLDVIKFLLIEYHVDGFRFDLMGLLDADLMNEICALAKFLRHDVMLYGEGWNMADLSNKNIKLANIDNASLLPNYAFFNDRYRNIARGHGSKAKLDECGFLLGNQIYKEGFKFVYLGSNFNVTFPSLFPALTNSLNYVECHDNATLFDAINCSIECENPKDIINLVNSVLLLSFGIPFIHAGQEIMLSKFNHHNTYNEGDTYNKFSYSLLDANYANIYYLKYAINARKKINIFHNDDKTIIANNVDFIDDYENILHIKIQDIDFEKSIYHIFINTTSNGKHLFLNKNMIYFVSVDNESSKNNLPFNHIDLPSYKVLLLKEI